MQTENSRKGFSLIELMVAIAILTIGMAAVGAILFASYESSRYNASVRRAEVLMAQLCERFKAGNVGTTAATDPCQRKLGTSGSAGFNPALDQCWNPDRNDGSYFCQWTTATHASGYRQLDATVYWGGTECERTKLDKCKRKLRMINYYKQYEP